VDGAAPATELASRWHTALLVYMMLFVAVAGTWLSKTGAPVSPHENASPIRGVYLPTIGVEWMLALYVARIGREANALPSLLGERWTTGRRALEDLLIAAAVFVLVEGSEMLAARLFGTGRNVTVLAMLPHTAAEHAVWFAFSASAGFCEELVYRGYLQTQFAAFTGSVGFAVFIQAVLFGVAHCQQGLGPALRFAFYGMIFGIVARTRRSLLPCVAAHIGIDLAAGLLSG
jgi:uncharacterized protein